MSEANSGRGAWVKILLLALFVCLILGGMGGYVWWRHEKWRWEKIPMRDSVAQVPKAWTLAELAERLHDKGRVRETSAFLEAARELKIRSVAPGGYLLPKEAGPRDLALLFSGPPQLVKITFRIDVADDGHERLRVDEFRERNVVQLQLTGDGDHDAAVSLFHQGPKGAHSELAAQHHIEGVGFGAAGLVTQL